MNIENLVTMANQIGAFYESMPDRKKALSDIADHIKKTWEPRMRREFLAHIDAHQTASGLSSIVLESVQANRAMLCPITVNARI
jgi:formate dehydrogenase subunit delta